MDIPQVALCQWHLWRVCEPKDVRAIVGLDDNHVLIGSEACAVIRSNGIGAEAE